MCLEWLAALHSSRTQIFRIWISKATERNSRCKTNLIMVTSVSEYRAARPLPPSAALCCTSKEPSALRLVSLRPLHSGCERDTRASEGVPTRRCWVETPRYLRLRDTWHLTCNCVVVPHPTLALAPSPPHTPSKHQTPLSTLWTIPTKT